MVATASAPPGFELQQLIGRGASGRVFQARQHSTSRLVALKVLDVDPASTDAGARFERECAVMGDLGGHPNIVTVYDAGRHEGQPWIAMELCHAGSLADRLARQGRMTVPEAVAVLRKIASALHTAHCRGMLHCDVKPANIMITEFGEPALGDFGIARLVGGRTRLSTIGGGFTLDHAPPEALNGENSTAAADVYSLGTTIWQLLEGQAPFSQLSDTNVGAVIKRILTEPLPALVRGDVPDLLRELLDAMTAKDPGRRPGDLSEVAEQAATINVGGPTTGLFSVPAGSAGLANAFDSVRAGAGAGVASLDAVRAPKLSLSAGRFATGPPRGGTSGAQVGVQEFATERPPGGASPEQVGVQEFATERPPGGASPEQVGVQESATERPPGGASAGQVSPDDLATAWLPGGVLKEPPARPLLNAGPGEPPQLGWGAAAPDRGVAPWAEQRGRARGGLRQRRRSRGPSRRRASGTGWLTEQPARSIAIALVVVLLLAATGVAVWWTMNSRQQTSATGQAGVGQVAGQPGAGQPGAGQPGGGQPGGQPDGQPAAQAGLPGFSDAAAPNGSPPGVPNIPPPPAPEADGGDAGSSSDDGSPDPSTPSPRTVSGTHTLSQSLGPNCDRPDYWRVSGKPITIEVATNGAVSGRLEGSDSGSVHATCDGVSGTIDWKISYKISFDNGKLSNGQFTATGLMTNIDDSTAHDCTRDGQPIACPPNVEKGPHSYLATIVGNLNQGVGAVRVNMKRTTAGTWKVS